MTHDTLTGKHRQTFMGIRSALKTHELDKMFMLFL